MNREHPGPRGPPLVQVIGILLAGFVAAAWAITTQDALHTVTPDTIAPPPLIIINWTYFLSSVVLLASSLFAGCFTFINEKKHTCHPKCNILFLALSVPGLSAASNLVKGPSDDVLMLAMSVQLIIVALIYCAVSTENSQESPSPKRNTVISLIQQFVRLDLGLQIFLLFAIFVSSFSLFPYAWRTLVPSGFWEVSWKFFVGEETQSSYDPVYARIVGLDGVIAVGDVLAALFGYQLVDSLPSKAGTVLQVNQFRAILLTFIVLSQALAIFWDMLDTHWAHMQEMRTIKEESKRWQGTADQLQNLTNVHEAAITTKSSFLTGLANEMKSIVHGTSMVMSMLNDTDLQPNQGTYIARLDRAVDRLTNLVREAQYYIEVESIKTSVESVPFRLDQLLEEVINSTSTRTHLEERDVDVTYLIDAPVPMNLLGDYSRLKNLLLRLLSNAIKATVQGEIVIWVRLNALANTPIASSGTLASPPFPSSPGVSPQATRRVLQPSPDPTTKLADLKISKLIPHEVLSSSSTLHSPPSTPSTPNREVSPRAGLASSQSFGSNNSPRNKRGYYGMPSTPESTETSGNSPRGILPRTISSTSLQRSSSLNTIRSGSSTPKTSSGYRPPPDFGTLGGYDNSDGHHRGIVLNGYTPPVSPTPAFTAYPGSPPTPTYLTDQHITVGDDMVQLSISVLDTGIGIPPEDLSRIFEPFAMVNRKRDDTDLGLGLSICKQLARVFGGTLTVHSELSRGSSFTLVCPFKLVCVFSTSIMLQRAWGIGKTICVIDNSSSIGAVCKMHLIPVGCEVLHYPSPVEAIAQMKVLVELGRAIDAVLIGYRLYGTNGEETAKLLRSDPDIQSVPIVFMCTAKQRKQITLSNAHFLYKPLKKEQLLTVVHMLCTTPQQPHHSPTYSPTPTPTPMLTPTHNSAPPSPYDMSRDFSNIPDPRAPRSPLSSSSPTFRNPLSTSHRLFPGNSLVTPLSLPTLPTLLEQDEKPRPQKNAEEEKEKVKDMEKDDNNVQEHIISRGLGKNGQEEKSQQIQQQMQQVQQLEQLQATSEGERETSALSVSTNPTPREPPVTPRVPTPHAAITPRTTPLTPTSPTPLSTLPIPILPALPTNLVEPPRRASVFDGSPSIAPIPHILPSVPLLPIGDLVTPPVPPTIPTAAPPETAPVAKKETILLVEDNPINAKIASAVLRRHQFEVELAGNGQIALEKVKLTHDNFQLILMDIHMPVMDGLTCARLVRQFEKEQDNLVAIPIIALTADATALHRTACLEAGCNEFMSKPLDYPLLIEILKKLSSGGRP